MKTIRIFILTLLPFVQLTGQTDSITLMRCLQTARQNAVINAQYRVVDDITDLKVANTRATYLPSLSAYGKAWYQSDAITVITPAGPGLEIDRFQYNTGLEADQKLYDGGLAKRGKELELATRESEINRIETEKYKLNNQVADLFFRALLFNKSLDVFQLKEELLNERVKEMESAYKQGIIKKIDLDKLKTERILLQQQKVEIEKMYEQSLAALSIITGIDISADAGLIINDSIFLISKNSRPEYRYFETETQRIENLAQLQKSRNLPKLFAYGQAGYSYPGLNFFENESDYYYIVGARLAWTIFDWKQVGREAEIIRKQKDIIINKQADFDQQLTIALERESIEQEKLREMIRMDEQIIRQREIITKGSTNALSNGAITSTDYLEDLNAEIKARLDRETHKLQLKSSKVRQRLLKGIDLDNS